jgi:hypothetical protein
MDRRPYLTPFFILIYSLQEISLSQEYDHRITSLLVHPCGDPLCMAGLQPLPMHLSQFARIY